MQHIVLTVSLKYYELADPAHFVTRKK